MRRTGSALAAIACFGLIGTGFAAAEPDGSTSRLDWIRLDGSIAWSAGLTHGEADTAEPDSLTGPLWFPPLPDIEVELIDDESRRLRDFEGKALLLAFWAVWCEPCAEELPALQAILDAERENGLEILAVNVEDDDGAARQFAWALDLRMPLARYGPTLDEAFHVRALPTTILFDRNGRLRKRWNRREPGTEQEIETEVRTLLDDAIPRPEATVGQVLSGGGRLAVRWTRQMPAILEGIAALRARTATDTRLVAVAGRELALFGSGGLVTERRPAPVGSGRLRTSDRDVIGFRPGSARVVRLSPDGETDGGWEAPAPVLDLAFERVPEKTPPTLLLATIDGLHRVALDGTGLKARKELGLLRAVAAPGSGPNAVLDAGGRLIWLNGALETVRTQQTSPSFSVLVSGGDLAEGVGLAPSSVTAASVGRYLDDDAAQIALAVDGQLVLLDLESGAERFRARWPDLGRMVASDLDGDGRHELIVSSGRRLSMLGVGPEPAILKRSSQ